MTTQETHTSLKTKLLKEQQRLLARRDVLTREDPFGDAGRVDDNADVGQEATEQWGHQRVEALRKEIDRTLVRIRRALSRMRIGKYGRCESCGKLIETERLMINPTADLCISCANKQSKARAATIK